MKQMPHNQSKEEDSSIAWFKLAELVSRGEKEKALTLYRLLSHSFEERGYALQLEGDLLWAFEDSGAINRYKQAAFLYKKEKNFIASAATYEHLLILQPKSYEIVLQLLELYVLLNRFEKVKDRFKILFGLYEDKGISVDNVWAAVEIVLSTLREQKEIKKEAQQEMFTVITDLLEERMPELELKAKVLYKENGQMFAGL